LRAPVEGLGAFPFAREDTMAGKKCSKPKGKGGKKY
jgi:hypothetical protein